MRLLVLRSLSYWEACVFPFKDSIYRYMSYVSEQELSTLNCLKLCAQKRDLQKGEKIHADVLQSSLLKQNIYICCAFVNMYAKCGAVQKAEDMFDNVDGRNVVLWTALITGYIENGLAEEALMCFQQMQLEGILADSVAFTCAMRACGSIGAALRGLEIHVNILAEGLLHKKHIVGNAAVDMYAKCSMLDQAKHVFNELAMYNNVTWTSLITGYAQLGLRKDALKYFERMGVEGFFPDAVTFACILKACGCIANLNKGKEVHATIQMFDMIEEDVVLGNALIDMYAKSGELIKAQELFNKLPFRDVISWSTLIAGYVQQSCGKEALHCFQQMQAENLVPDRVTFASILKACGISRATDKGQELHAEILRCNLIVNGNHNLLGNALVDMYAKCGLLEKSKEVFEFIVDKNVVSWNTLITGYVQHGHDDEVLSCFEDMQADGLFPDRVTYISVLKACSQLGVIGKAQEIHSKIIKEGSLESDTVISTTLVDTYASCCMLVEAQDVFDRLPVQDTTSWSAVIAGYAQSGRDKSVIDTINKMIEQGKELDLITSTILLNACSHVGLLENGERLFETMGLGNGIMPSLEHYSCMIDLFGRAGNLDKVQTLITEMPYSANLMIWHSVLGACMKWGDVKLGRLAFDHVLQLHEDDAAPYVCMYNIYVCAGMQEDADKIEAMRLQRIVLQ